MEVLKRDTDFVVSDTIFKKIVKEFKAELKENTNNIKKLNEIDYNYNKRIVDVDNLINIIDCYSQKNIVSKKTKNVIISYYGDPRVTVQICLLSLLNCQRINILIDDMCLGINKMIVELFKDILKDYRLNEIISFNNFVSKSDIDMVKDKIDTMYCLGNHNMYTICRKIERLDIKYIPFNIIDIYCENEELADLSQKIFETCFENEIETEMYEDINFEEAVDNINNYGENYCSVILTKNKEYMDRFKKEIKSKFVFVNENPLKDDIFMIPEIF